VIATDIALLLLPIAAFSGWCASRVAEQKRREISSLSRFPRDYFVGLNFLLNEQPDKAVDVFVKMLEVDSDTVETHLALGSLFRRRGEVERAIRIHQNLIARPNLSREMHAQSLLELGQDYFAAGVFDRAERIFQEVVESGEHIVSSLRFLLDIYQQEKSWKEAVETAERLESATGELMSMQIAHYYCELAQEHINNAKAFQAEMRRPRSRVAQCINEYMSNEANGQQSISLKGEGGHVNEAYRCLRKALSIDKASARASMLLGQLEEQSERYKPAIRYFKEAIEQDPDLLMEVLLPLERCHAALDMKDEFMRYLYECLATYPRISIILLLADRIATAQGERRAADFIVEQLRQYPSIRGLHRLIQLHIHNADNDARGNLEILEYLTAKLLENKPVYRCGHCGFAAKSLHWLCPGCRRWSTIKPIHGLEGD
jgi:lipopolysaccharide biosynthesis regulator YciM